MRLFAKKTFLLGAPDGAEIIVRANTFADIGDKFAKCETFRRAVAAQDISVIDSKAEEKKAETGPEKPLARYTKAELEQYAEKHEIDLAGCETRTDIYTRITAMKLDPAEDPEAQEATGE